MIDLIATVRSTGKNSMGKVEIIGRPVRVVKRPCNIQNSVETLGNGVFVALEIFAVNLSRHKSLLESHGISDTILYSRGEILTYIEANKFNSKRWYSITATLGIDFKHRDFLSILQWCKENNKWGIVPVELQDVDSFYFNGLMRDYFEQSVECNKVVQPKRVETLPIIKAEINSLEPNNNVKENNENIIKENNPIIYNKKKYKYSDNDKVKPISKVALELQAELDITYDKIKNFNEVVNIYYGGIVQAWDNKNLDKVCKIASQDKKLLYTYLNSFPNATKRYLGRKTVKTYLVSIFESEIIPFIKDNVNNTVTVDGKAWEVCKKAFGDEDKFCAGILGIKYYCDFTKVNAVLKGKGLHFADVFFTNPWLLFIYNPNMKFTNICNIALDLNLLDKNTYYADIASILDYMKYGNSTAFYKKNITKVMRRLPLKYKDKQGYFIYELGKSLKAFLESGYGIEYNGLLTTCEYAKKELDVYFKLSELAKTQYDYNESDIDMYINEYENIVGFRLEPEQRKGVHLIRNKCAVVSGIAGSGKTTLTDCMVYVLSKLEPDCEIYFSAPTGKAAKRLQEVVKDEVRTFHSRFHIACEDNEIDNIPIDSDANGIHVFDEAGMMTLDLLHTVLSKVGNRRVYIFGDFNQLEPIGKGTPFRDMLKYLPCVFLKASKRAVQGSNITYNANLEVNNSDYGVYANLVDGKDFFRLQCENNEIEDNVVRIVKHYLHRETLEEYSELVSKIGELPVIDGLDEDDIQVISPVTKTKYNWGTTRLNERLQKIFNMSNINERNKFVYRNRSFYIGDRVIHTNRNMYDMQWYRHIDGNKFELIDGVGIFNGEVGKIKGVYNTVELIQNSFILADDNIRDDTTWGNSFVAVEYYDCISDDKFCILYRCTEKDTGVMVGEDLEYLDLFYAGTVHKLQGSQAKLAICVLGSVDYSGFLTRNLVYTMFTRASKLEFVVGSVNDYSMSQLSKARKDNSDNRILTIGEVISNEEL